MKNNQLPDLDWEKIDLIIENAFAEDIGDGDVTTNSLFKAEEKAAAFMKVKADGIIAGLPIAERVFRKLDPDFGWETNVAEGAAVAAETVFVEMKGARRALLSGERLALNILQRLSGIATQTAAYVKAAGNTKVKILDTRKTLPGLRVIEKYAVAVGGGQNHRFGLFDAIMIKDNHIKLAGGIAKAVHTVRQANTKNLPVEVETSNLAEVEEALTAGADIIMLDNMSNDMMRQAVQKIGGRAKVEASGGITLERIASIAETGVDYISVGALTHSVKALDIGLYFYG